jgi:hypothetical protein
LRAAAVGLLCIGLFACGGSGNAPTGYPVAVQLTPPTPAVGSAVSVDVRVEPPGGDAHWPGATLELEAHMSHPGMAPIVTRLTERGGAYHAELTFTMAGEWTLFVSGTLPDGRRVRTEAGRHAVLPSR